MSITITIEGQDAQHARREMLALLGERTPLWRQTESGPFRIDEPRPEDAVTAGEIVDKLQAALAEDADGVEFPAAAAEPPKKRGRPRKEAPVVDAEPSPAAEPEQIDIEDAIADSMATTPATVEEMAETPTPQPEDQTAGWTIQDARNAGRALLDRAPDVETGNRKLAATLVPFGVQQVKALKEDQIEAFVVATTKAVF